MKIILHHLSHYNFVLASASPRRKELLAGLDIDFEVRPISGEIPETYPLYIPKYQIPIWIAQEKAEAYKKHWGLDKYTFLITADTIIRSNGCSLGKPKNREEAKEILYGLSGRIHEVITGVCLTTTQKQISFHAVSSVFFTTLAEEEINYYVDKYQPYDKAGSYGIQEWIGYIGIEKINGSYYNVMGLPVKLLYDHLRQWQS